MAKRHLFQVEGRSEFPIDMLRYDGCYPATQDSVNRIVQSLRDSYIIPDERLGIIRVEVVGHQAPTIARWKSFGWEVLQSEKIS